MESLQDLKYFEVDSNFKFFNPKTGLTYQANDVSQFYFSFSKAQREPSRVDYENGNPKPEVLNNFELGWRVNRNSFQDLFKFIPNAL